MGIGSGPDDESVVADVDETPEVTALFGGSVTGCDASRSTPLPLMSSLPRLCRKDG